MQYQDLTFSISYFSGVSPKWYQDLASNTMEFSVGFPQVAMLQFALFSSSNELLGQRCVPVDYMREG